MKQVKTFGSKLISWMYKPSAYRIKSKTLYLQMINPKDSVVWQEKISRRYRQWYQRRYHNR